MPSGNLAIVSSGAYLSGMNAPQFSVRSKRARDLAHELSRREGRSIHEIVEAALIEYARRHPQESAAAFLKRMRASAPVDEEAVAELEAALEEHKAPHRGVAL